MVLRADRNVSVDSDRVSNLFLLFVARTHVLTVAFVHGSKYYFYLSISVSFYRYEYQIIATIPTVLSVSFPCFPFLPYIFQSSKQQLSFISQPEINLHFDSNFQSNFGFYFAVYWVSRYSGCDLPCHTDSVCTVAVHTFNRSVKYPDKQ